MDEVKDDTETRDDYDSAWKEGLEQYFPQFMVFFFPQADVGIDWARGYEFLDKELQQVARDAALGKRHVDKLVKVWQKDGDEAWVLIHVEVQSQEELAFPERMYVYNYRLFDRYHRRIASLAVLGDERTNWRPDRYEQGLWGCRMQFEFPVVKLLDYRKDWAALEASRNPFTTIVMAHLKTQETRHDVAERHVWKFRLIRRLYEQGYAKEDIIGLFRFIDWLMRLPEEAEAALWHDIQAYEEEERMDYITSVERIGIKKGFQQGEQRGLRKGLLEGISLGLELKFGSEGLRLLPEIRKIEDVDMLWTIHEGLKVVETVEALGSLYRPEGAE